MIPGVGRWRAMAVAMAIDDALVCMLASSEEAQKKETCLSLMSLYALGAFMSIHVFIWFQRRKATRKNS